MAWTNPRTFVAGEMIPAADLNTYVRDNLDFLKPRVQAGSVSITPVANTATSTTVVFPVPFASAPRVVVSPGTVNPGTQVKGVSATSTTTTQFTAWVYRTNTTNTPVRWVATLLDV